MRFLPLAIALMLAFPFAAHGHSGGLDANGGHYDRKNGGYHYHRRVSAPKPKPKPPKTITFRDSIEQSKPSDPKSDGQIKRLMIQESLARYSGNCPCPYNVDRARRRCGKRSAYSKPGGASPLCYNSDVTQRMVDAYRTRFNVPEPPSEPGRFFLPFHDRKAEAALVKVEYGNIANMLAAHGYGPDKSVMTAKEMLGE